MRQAVIAGLLFIVAGRVLADDATKVSRYLADHRRTANATLRPAATISSTPCFGNFIQCGETFPGFLDTGCSIFGGPAADFFEFDGTQGEFVTITMVSSDFPPFIDLQEPSGDPGNGASGGGTTTTPAQVSFTLDNSGAWTIGAGNLNLFPQSGNYSLSVVCSGGGTGNCSTNENTLCLNANRFKVTATYNAGSNGGSGNANCISLTDDTGYLWFFQSNNLEAVVKVLDGCGLNGHYWVFAGGLTNVNVVITVTDTSTGKFQRYTNPANTKFQPIQDTSAFSTCP